MYISDYLSFLKKLKKEFDLAEQKLAIDDTTPGYAMAVFHDNHMVLERYCGVKDLRTKKKIDADTQFLLASLTKPLVANAFLKNINIVKNNQANHYLNNVPQNITIGHLIKHQSGLQDYILSLIHI